MYYGLFYRLEELGYKSKQPKNATEDEEDVIPMKMLTIKKMNQITDKKYIKVII